MTWREWGLPREWKKARYPSIPNAESPVPDTDPESNPGPDPDSSPGTMKSSGEHQVNTTSSPEDGSHSKQQRNHINIKSKERMPISR